MNKVELFLQENSIIENLYDILRLVDPFTKKVIDTKFINGYENKVKGLESMNFCYDFWGDNKPCDNCISARVMNDNKVYMKTEYNGEEVFIITSLLVKVENQEYILELINEITDKGILDELQGKDYYEIKQVLKEKNMQLITDELTKSYNRRFINERLPFEIINSNKKDENIVIAMADIDYFKNVNDTYGHDAGDFILKEVVKIINNCIRYESDWVGRFGGEEFIIFFKNIPSKVAFDKLNEIRKEIESKEFKYEEDIIKITVSFGMSEYDGKLDMANWIKEADENLYKSKDSGRNQVTWK